MSTQTLHTACASVAQSCQLPMFGQLTPELPARCLRGIQACPGSQAGAHPGHARPVHGARLGQRPGGLRACR